MSQGTGIQWTEATWNPVVGCTPVSAGCANCYAVTMTHRLGEMAEKDKAQGRSPGRKANYTGLTVLQPNGRRHFNGTVRCVEEALTIPLRWRKPRRIFVNSMSDLFHASVPFEFIDRVFAVMALTPQHTYQVLTKRPERMAEYLNDDGGPRLKGRIFQAQIDMATQFDIDTTRPGQRYPSEFKKPMQCEWPLPNVWLGTSVENQEQADKRIQHLLRCPAAVRFLSCEPLLSAVDLRDAFIVGPEGGADWFGAPRQMIHWVIAGGESGAGARPCDVAWLRSLRDQCAAAGVAYFQKQLGKAPLSMERWNDWERGPNTPDGKVYWMLADQKGRNRAEVWGGTWHTWDEDGIGGENGVDDDDTIARREAVKAIKRQQWNTMPLRDSHGGDESEWPEDLRGCRAWPETAVHSIA